MKKALSIVVAGLIGCSASIADSDSHWITLGPVYRGGMEAEVRGSSYTQMLGIHASGGLRSPDGVGNADQYGDRTYDDGYVRRDPGTGNPASIDPDVTWNWGYDNDSQYNSAVSELYFHRRGGKGYQKTLDAPFSAEDDLNGIGVEAVGGLPVRRGRFNLDLCMGLQVVFGADTEIRDTTYEEGFGRLDVTDTYDVSGVNLPSAPHRGTYDGPFDSPPVIPSPTIPNRPESRSVRLLDQEGVAANRIAMDIDADVYALWLGPRLVLQISEQASVNVTPRLTLNWVDVEADRSEVFEMRHSDGSRSVLNSWLDQNDDSRLMFGAGVTVGANLELNNGFFAGIWAGYEWVSEDVNVQVGPNTVSFDAGGYTAGALIGYRFKGGPSGSTALRSRLPEQITEAHPAPEPESTADIQPLPDAQIPGLQAEQTLNRGRRIYETLQTWVQNVGDRTRFRQALQTMKTTHPNHYAALKSYWTHRKTDQIQLVMR